MKNRVQRVVVINQPPTPKRFDPITLVIAFATGVISTLGAYATNKILQTVEKASSKENEEAQ